MKWHDILRKGNEYAKAATDQAIEAHADPKVQIAQRLQSLQEHHDALEASGRSYSYRGTTFTYHPAAYWNAYPLNPYNPYDARNFHNPNSPYYGEHLVVSC